MYSVEDQTLEAQIGHRPARVSNARAAIRQFRWRLIFIVVFCCMIIAYLLSPLGVLLEAQQDESQYGTLVPMPTSGETASTLIELHPKDHKLREPTTIQLSWKMTTGFERPDGVLKRIYLINDAFPGPTIEARSGDRLVVEVENALETDEAISIHWHGLSMRRYNDMDGAAGITQDPILPGANFTYEFQIEMNQFGTFWYHAHDGVQRADGMYGGLVVHEPGLRTEEGLSAEHLLLVGDWYHRPAMEVLGWYLDPGNFGMEPTPDSILVNGAGRFNCSNAVPSQPINCEHSPSVNSMMFDATQRIVVRVINVGSFASFTLNTVQSTMSVVAVDGGNSIDGVPTERVGLIAPGERVDLTIAPRNPGHNDTALSIVLDKSSFKIPNPGLTVERRLGVQWKGVALHSPSQDVISNTPFDLQHASTAQKGKDEVPAGQTDQYIILYTKTEKLAHLNNVPRGFINHTSWRPQSSSLNKIPANEWDQDQLVPHVHYDSKVPLWVDVVLNNLDEDAHPFHFHGYSFWVLATYSSPYNWGSFNPFEDELPPGGSYEIGKALKKDTVIVPRRGYAILRFRADNPGVWMLHCHVLWHQASGMAMAIDVS